VLKWAIGDKYLKFQRFNGEANEFNSIHLKIRNIHNSFDNNRLAHYTVKIYSALEKIVYPIGDLVVLLIKPLKKVSGLLKNLFGRIFSNLSSAFSSILGVASQVAAKIVTLARGFFVFESVIQVFSTLGKATSGLIRRFSKISGTIISTFFAVAQNVPAVINRIFSQLTALPGRILAIVQKIPAGISAAFSMMTSVARGAVNGISSAFTGLVSFFSGLGKSLVITFSAALGMLGGIVSGFGDFFVSAFGNVGVAIGWLQEQFKNLRSFATETYNALAAAFGRGDIEAAVQLAWATIKLIWVQGTGCLLSTWYWLVDTLLTTWASCVYKLSEILTTAWYGVQQFWIETVYTMSTIWAEFSGGVVSAWKTAEKTVAKGIGYLMAQIQGIDFNELSKVIDEDYNRQSKQRESAKSQRLVEIQKSRDSKMSSLESDKKGVLDILKSDFENNTGLRDAAYQAKLAAQQQELDAAKAAYDEAIKRARNPEIPQDQDQGGKTKPAFDQIKNQLEAAVQGFRAGTDLESKISVTGSFSAAAIASMGATSTMDRVANATEQSEKHLAKIASKEEKSKPAPEPKKEIHVAEPDDKAVAELKIHTRLLRDLSTKGGAVFV